MKTILQLVAVLIPLFAQSQTPVKKVLMEEFTTVLCGVCPPVTYDLNQFHDSQPNSILVTLHEGFGRDSMSNPDSYSIFTAFDPSWGSFAPAIMVERTVYPSLDSIPYLSTFTSGYDTLVTNALQEPPLVGIQISSTYFPGIGSLHASVTATFTDPLPAGNYRVNLFLVEDSVTGVGYPGYAQKCYDANFVAQHYPGYPYANDTISGYPHRYVLRKSLTGNALGTSQTVPVLTAGQSPTVGVPYTFTMSTPFVLPFNYNFDRLYLVASVNQYQAGSYTGNEVINAERVKVSENITSGISTAGSLPGFSVYPNPVMDKLKMTFTLPADENCSVFITDMTGRVVFSKVQQAYSSGHNQIEIITEALAPGYYSLHLDGEKNKITDRIVILK